MMYLVHQLQRQGGHILVRVDRNYLQGRSEWEAHLYMEQASDDMFGYLVLERNGDGLRVILGAVGVEGDRSEEGMLWRVH